MTAPPGGVAVLSCQAGGSVRYNLTWQREGEEVGGWTGRVRILSNSSLEIDPVTPQDAGQYHCVASNDQGESRAAVWLLVPGKHTQLCIYFHHSFSTAWDCCLTSFEKGPVTSMPSLAGCDTVRYIRILRTFVHQSGSSSRGRYLAVVESRTLIKKTKSVVLKGFNCNKSKTNCS